MILKFGDHGADVLAMQYGLIACGYPIKADGWFGNTKTGEDETGDALEMFQRAHGLKPDRLYGPLATAKLFPGSVIDTLATFQPMSSGRRAQTFGEFAYKAAGGDNITITDGWEERNIRKFYIPQLDGIPFYEPGSSLKCSGMISLHRLAGPLFQRFFQRVEDARLCHLIKTFDGSFVPRFVRGSKTSLSNHAWGTAIDINAYANGLGATPAPVGASGSLIALVPIAHTCGIYWGGNFSRPDGMHLEIAAL